MRHLRVVLALAGLVLMASLFTTATPAVSASEKVTPGGGFLTPETIQSLVEGDADAAGKSNCYWTCNDGRTGEAEVKNYPDDCKALCELACGGKCTEIK